jgi:hypothetical protein
MSRVEELIAQMPEKEARYAERERVMEVEESIGGEPIHAIVRCAFPFGTMMVTDRRLIVVLQDGGLQAMPYTDISRVEVLEGSKGFRGRKPSLLVVSMRGGDRYEMTIGASDGDYSLRISRIIEKEYSNFILKNS